MDLNGGLTQVLQDGTNTYLYGVGRIAQYGTNGAEYYLGDALGSVRQLVDTNGNVTLGRMYKPYGGVLSSAGSGATSYGYTNEWTDSSTGEVYLRARWYAPGQGRFLTKDTWDGDVYAPMSFNLWNYVQSNPINYQDPTGNDRYPPSGTTPCSIGIGGGWTHWNVITRVNEAERYVYHTSDPMDTYVAAGIAIQCAGTDFPKDPWSSMGIAQVSYPQAETEWEQEVKDEEGLIRSYGLRKRCSNGELEPALDPKNPKDAVILMRRRIQMVIDNCKGKGKDCNDTDRYIAAGLAQNGSGFTHIDMRKIPDITSKTHIPHLILANLGNIG